jgi:hypothetical protein
MSSLSPADSASQGGKKKKSRPGKAERAAARGLSEAPASDAPTSLSGARAFSAGAVSAPVPQPGKYPVVFPSGAGEPTRDLGLAQQTVHAHQNMGLPVGDFSVIASSDVINFNAIRAVLSQFGEFQSESLGTRFLLAGYESTVKACVRAAMSVQGATSERIAETFWLPTARGDVRTRFYVASALSHFLRPFGVSLDVSSLSDCVFHKESEAWTAVKSLLGEAPPLPSPGIPNPPDPRDRFDFLFRPYKTEDEFFNLVSPRADELGELGLAWSNPAKQDLAFGMVPKVEFSPLVDGIARSRATYAKFFSLGSGLSNRSVAAGSPAQMSSVEDKGGVIVVRSRVAVSAPEFSLLACFPFSGLFSGLDPLNVVVTTSLNVAQRATEFTQLDWL